MTYNVWQKLVPLLAPHFQLILVELPGMSAASQIAPDTPYYEFCAEKLEEFRLTIGIERWAILSYSTGTRAAEAYIQRFPQQVTQATFLCPIYLTRPWMMTIQAGQWVNTHYAKLGGWFISGWRLYGWLLGVGFNLRERAHALEWMGELEQRPFETLKRQLLELPGRGRAPFTLPGSPPVPSLFVWARHDLLAARPANPRPNDVFIFASHGGALLCAPEMVAAVVVPFFKGEFTASQTNLARQNERRLLRRVSKRFSQGGQSHA